ncbi:hypothetical protein C0J52_18044, partial [Blattella germanica]
SKRRREDLYVEEYTVAEVSLDGDTENVRVQHEVEEYQDTDRDDDIEDVNTNTIEYGIQDHRYISQPRGFQKLNENKQNNITKYVICSPDDHIDSFKASWTRDMTQILIEEYRNMVDAFRNPHRKQKELWYELSKNMVKRGCDVTWDMCDRKWRNLKHTFKTIYYNQQRPDRSKRRWEFYNALEELYLIKGTTDEAVRKSRAISPPPVLEDQDSMSAGTGLNPRPAKVPRLAPQVSYAQVLDVGTLQNPIVSYPQIVLCDEDGVPINKKQNIASTSGMMTDESDDNPLDNAPSWFIQFMKQYKVDEERRLSVLREMHAETIQVEKRKCAALETLLNKLM